MASGNGAVPLTPSEGASHPPMYIPLCTSVDSDEEDVDFSHADPESTNRLDTLSAWVPRNVIWPRERKQLGVKFLNIIPHSWTYDGNGMNTGNIMSWANKWSDLGNGIIPEFIHIKDPNAPSDIRVKFTANGKAYTIIGKKAEKSKNHEPTMWLDLHSGSGMDDRHKKHLVIHEFGHALGLGHEHQRSDFWKHIKPYVDLDAMKSSLGVNDQAGESYFIRDWGETKDFNRRMKPTPYDPKSVMHYWFLKEWLKGKYSVKREVEKDTSLTPEVRSVLLGVHERDSSVADRPSELDIALLMKHYSNVNNERGDCIILGPPAPGVVQEDMDINTVGEEMELDGGLPQVPHVSAPVEAMCDPGRLPDHPAEDGTDTLPGDPTEAEPERLPNDPIWETKPTPGYLQLLKWYDGDNKIQYLRLFQELISHWRRAAETLHISNAVINYIAEEKMAERIRKVIGKWLDNGSRLPQAKLYPVSWRGFYDLLCDMEKTELATTLKCAMSAKRSNIRNTFR